MEWRWTKRQLDIYDRFPRRFESGRESYSFHWLKRLVEKEIDFVKNPRPLGRGFFRFSMATQFSN